MTDLDDPAEFEALMLRLAARRVLETCWRDGAPEPQRAKAILGDRYRCVQGPEDSQAFIEWCGRHGLEFLVYDGVTGSYHAMLDSRDGSLIHCNTPQGPDYAPPTPVSRIGNVIPLRRK